LVRPVISRQAESAISMMSTLNNRCVHYHLGMIDTDIT
jgi:hypothetical protein